MPYFPGAFSVSFCLQHISSLGKISSRLAFIKLFKKSKTLPQCGLGHLTQSHLNINNLNQVLLPLPCGRAWDCGVLGPVHSRLLPPVHLLPK